MKTAVIVIDYDSRESLIEILQTGIMPDLEDAPENVKATDGVARGKYKYEMCLLPSNEKVIAQRAVNFHKQLK